MFEPYFPKEDVTAIEKEIIDDLLKGRDPKTVFSSDGLLGELKKILADRILNAEMDEHLSEPKQDEVTEDQKPGNTTTVTARRPF